MKFKTRSTKESEVNLVFMKLRNKSLVFEAAFSEGLKKLRQEPPGPRERATGSLLVRAVLYLRLRLTSIITRHRLDLYLSCYTMHSPIMARMDRSICANGAEGFRSGRGTAPAFALARRVQSISVKNRFTYVTKSMRQSADA